LDALTFLREATKATYPAKCAGTLALARMIGLKVQTLHVFSRNWLHARSPRPLAASRDPQLRGLRVLKTEQLTPQRPPDYLRQKRRGRISDLTDLGGGAPFDAPARRKTLKTEKFLNC
jgi:hypothetical protein